MSLLALQAEQVIVGCCLQGQILLEQIDGLRPDAFAGESHREAFAAILGSWSQGLPVDPVRLQDLLRDRGTAREELGYWIACSDSGFSVALLPGHIARVREMAARRALLATADRIAALAHEGGDIGEQIAAASAAVAELSQEQGEKRGLRVMADVVRDFLPEFGKRFEPKQDGVPTGFRDLDAVLHQMRPGNLVLVAARPAMGKTSFAMQIATREAERGGAVAVFSQEMADLELAARMFSSVGRIPLEGINRGELSSDDHERFASAVSRLQGLKLFIDDQPAQRLADIRTKVQRLRRRHPLSLVVIDYLQLMEGTPSKSSNRNSEIEQISRGLKAMAKELGCPVIALSQLNRDLERRPNKRPVLSDLRDSGAIEQDADIVLMLYRDEVYNPDSPDKGTAEVLIRKHRQGATGVVRLSWQGAYTSFGDLAPGWVEREAETSAGRAYAFND
ncbi:replicative DNA helicase [Azoarcus indigens]|uniref:Replicative DNA helicase n=1 Tax=Azoarcus indigens TaxID=29545 RepID=A0A4R6DVD7_9RHOO|nr:replicative DNA helicase [Azoarcus indigens]NMG64357.1 replicative DNA helicase [Azoarcus indigens]TDN49190.1 replicative DNA helicase [Azoarcus indigens]